MTLVIVVSDSAFDDDDCEVVVSKEQHLRVAASLHEIACQVVTNRGSIVRAQNC
jgi:hypothetical protein